MANLVESDVLRRARTLEAARDYQSIAALLEHVPVQELLAEPELAYLLADARRRSGKRGAALELVRALLPVCRARGNDRLCRRRSNLEGICLLELGDLAGAEAEWNRLLDAATAGGDYAFMARACQNLAIVFMLTGRPEHAVEAQQRAIAAYGRMADLRGLAQAHNNLAIVYRDMGLLLEADGAFREALQYARLDRSEDELARIEQEWALLLAACGDVDAAEAAAARAEGRFRTLGQAVGVADAMRVLGVIALWNGRPLVARTQLQQALLSARELHARLLEAETLEALACLALLEGDPSSVRREEAKAEAIFQEICAVAWGRRIRQQIRERLPLPA